MPRYKPSDTTQTLMVAIRLDDQLIPGTFEHALRFVVDEKIDLEPLGRRWFDNETTGAPAYHPACLLKVVLLGYSRGLYSSRSIARACRENVLFMALSGDNRPHFTTIAWFVRNLREEVLSIFCNILLICSEMGLVGGELFAVDGCKIPSNASKEWSGTFEELESKRKKIRQRIQTMMDSHVRQDRREADRGGQGHADNLRCRVQRQRRMMRRIEVFLASERPKAGSRGKERQSNVTDNDSAKLHSGHGVIQGYNALAVVDAQHQIIVAAQPVAAAHEGEHLQQILDQAEANAKRASLGDRPLQGTTLLADTGYYSEQTLKLCADRGIDAYIPDPRFRRRDPRFPKTNPHLDHKGLYTREDFRFDPRRNLYICPQGKVLRLNTSKARVSRFEGERYQAHPQDCRACPQAHRCLKKGARRRKLHVLRRTAGPDLLAQMRHKIDSPRGRARYALRMQIVEPVFGNITTAKRMDRFTLRGTAKVRVQWLLYSMVHNVEKIAHYGNLDRPPKKDHQRRVAPPTRRSRK